MNDTLKDSALGRYGDASGDVLTEACAQWELDDPDDYRESFVKVGLGALRLFLGTMVGPNAAPELVFGTITGAGELRVVSRMAISKTN